MERKFIIKLYNPKAKSISYAVNSDGKNPWFHVDIAEAYFFKDRSEYEPFLNKACNVMPGYIWEIKTVYHV